VPRGPRIDPLSSTPIEGQINQAIGAALGIETMLDEARALQGRQIMTQLGFGDLLADADEANTQRKFDRATAHLPGTMAEALPFYRAMIDRHHHAAMLAADVEQAMAIRKDLQSPGRWK
jgi:hypothetical protein